MIFFLTSIIFFQFALMNKSRTKFSFCCYEIEHDQEESYRPSQRRLQTLMLNQHETSKIKFQTDFRNRNIPIYKILEDLYDGSCTIEQILPDLRNKRVNPELLSRKLSNRDDLEYYIPQIITFMVLECNLQNHQLNDLILNACMTDFYFAHSVYFYLQSLSESYDGVKVEVVNHFIQYSFLPKMGMYQGHHLSGHQFVKSLAHFTHIEEYEVAMKGTINDENHEESQNRYGEIQYPNPPPDFPEAVEKVMIKPYQCEGFEETPKFWEDLINIGDVISTEPAATRMDKLSQLIKLKVNQKLPATVYIPFYSKKVRLYTVLCVWQGRVFSTKQRAPFSIWLELYRQEEEHGDPSFKQFSVDEEEDQNEPKKERLLKKIYERISKPFTIADGQNTLSIKQMIKNKTMILEETFKKKRAAFRSFTQDDKDRPPSLSLVYEAESNQFSVKSSEHSVDQIIKSDSQSEDEVKYFPKKSEEVIQDYKNKSIYRNLKSWRMMHLMVKLGDDLRQQQFAMQLINRFQYIFQKQKINCVLRPYQVVSLGPNFGLIEMLNDVTTLDALFRKLSLKKMSLQDFFENYWKDDVMKAKKNFMRSLAGYSLVTYFLQVKDRHNGNILLHRDGSIIHIDFGFFLSNAPGKGVELQKKVPFKLLTQYVQVLGSLKSEMFFEFRQLFYHGFKAILNNQEMIVPIVKMMYKSQGQMMECFNKGQRAIQELEYRFNPGGNIEDFCYDLINNSLDNWRAKWYDKFQYFLQKIYY